MKRIDVTQIVTWTAGRLAQGASTAALTGISTDSRDIRPQQCFVALEGENFDGHDFVNEALAKGAGAVVVNNAKLFRLGPLPNDIPVVAVGNTTKALANIAGGYAAQFDIPVVAVTGSNGKTSTKDMIGSILNRIWPIVVTEKNYNNEIGLPLTLLRLESRHRAAVVELGMRSLGEIAQLAEVARPTHGVVTNVGPVHLERLGTMERVADAKAELVEALTEDGTAIINADDQWVRRFADRTQARVISFGFSEHADIRAVNVESKGLEGSSFDLMFHGERIPISLRVPGLHHVQNAAAAGACALSLGLSVKDVQDGLMAFTSGDMRLSVTKLKRDVTLVNDAYNASPLSVSAALDVLARTDAKRKVAVLGDMLELGSISESAHRQIGKEAVESGVSLLIAVGEFRNLMAEGAVVAGLPGESVLRFENSREAAASVREWVTDGDVVLVKGSRGVQLERVADEIQRQFASEKGAGTS